MDTIIALHRNYSGDIISFQTSSGRIISYRKALMEVENGIIDGVTIDSNSVGERVLSPMTEESFDHYPQIY
ncbi:DUF3892 domain-containing protein [Pseudoneobacillus sp. C159]